MPVEWTSHRFSGGALALDLANTVVHRNRPDVRFDRFADAGEIARFSAAARRLREDEFGPGAFREASAEAPADRVIALREAVDAVFRTASEQGGSVQTPLLPALLHAAGDLVEGQDGEAFETALARSTLSLIEPGRASRIRVCPNCAWLFLDKSRNGSRLWCDMAVCGNRAKARRHYRKSRGDHRA